MDSHSAAGAFTVKLLDLNDPKMERFRNLVIASVANLKTQRYRVENIRKKLLAKLKADGGMSAQAQSADEKLLHEIATIDDDISLWYGLVPVP